MIASLRNRWFVVAAATIGIMFSSGPVNIFTFGVFLKPITEEFHIGRGTLGSAMLIVNWIGALSGPVIGCLLDRFGARRVMLPGIALFALATATQSLLTPALLVIYVLFALKAITGAGASPIAYAFVVAKWFDRRRGLALGLALAGVGLGTSVVPLLVAQMIGAWGWRAAYLGLGLCVLVAAGVPVALFIREPSEAERPPGSVLAGGVLPGLSWGDALTRSWRFWGLAVAFLMGVIALNGTIVHLPAILMDRGSTMTEATAVLAASGIAAVCGRIASGWCVDRMFAPYVAVGFFILPMIGTALLGSGAGGAVPLVAAVLCGVALGAEIDLMAFFTSRYFGLKAFGKILGTLFGIFSGATGVGPYLSGLSFDLYHSYVPAFALYEGALLIACLLFLPLGPYPYPAPHRRGREPIPAKAAA